MNPTSNKASVLLRVSSALSLIIVATTGALCGQKAGVNPQMLIQQQACVQNIQQGDYERAETRCKICLEYDERNAECLNGMGLVWYARGVDEKADEYFFKAVRENNDFAQARNNMGVLRFQNGRFEEAAPMFLAAVEIDPRYADGRYNLALTHLRLGQNKKVRAEAELSSLIGDGEKNVGEEVWTAAPPKARDTSFHQVMKHFKISEDHYRRMFELHPNHIDSYRDMGLIMTYRAAMEKSENDRRTDLLDAERYFVRCLDLNSTSEGCHESLAHVLLVLGRYDEALFHYVQCLAAEKNNPVCQHELKLAYEGSQLKEESIQAYMEQLAKNPGYGMGHYGFCLALFKKGLVDMAVTECENAIKLDETISKAVRGDLISWATCDVSSFIFLLILKSVNFLLRRKSFFSLLFMASNKLLNPMFNL